MTRVGTLLLWTHRLERAVARRTWGEGGDALRQLVGAGRRFTSQDGVGPAALRSLQQHGVDSLETLLHTPAATVDS